MTDPERFQCQINSTWPNEGIMSSSHDFPLQPRPYAAFFLEREQTQERGKGGTTYGQEFGSSQSARDHDPLVSPAPGGVRAPRWAQAVPKAGWENCFNMVFCLDWKNFKQRPNSL